MRRTVRGGRASLRWHADVDAWGGAAVRRGLRGRKKQVVLVRGDPGNGKSVVAIHLVAEFLREGRDAHYATGSRAFTETLRDIVGPRSEAMFKYLWGPDLVYDFERQAWVGHKWRSEDSVVKRSKERFVRTRIEASASPFQADHPLSPRLIAPRSLPTVSAAGGAGAGLARRMRPCSSQSASYCLLG